MRLGLTLGVLHEGRWCAPVPSRGQSPPLLESASKRPHQGIGNRRPSAVRTGHQNPELIDGPVGEVECEEFLGGPLKSYHRAAA